MPDLLTIKTFEKHYHTKSCNNNMCKIVLERVNRQYIKLSKMKQ